MLAEARELAGAADTSLPLYGIPVAVKDNIDVKGLPTTAACPAYAYRPNKDATAVARLRAAGALVLGKTNLDQFATGLVGVRTPYGIPRNLFDAKLIPGGSSSGSAVAVGAGLVPLALGTDTAGSGRVPAAFSNVVGLKPSRGLVSAAGVVPACRTLDCVSILAFTVDDAMTALSAIAGADPADAFSHPRQVHPVGPMPDGLRLGVPIPGQRLFFGDRASEAAYAAALTDFAGLGAKIVEIDIEPFYAAARLLYEGPWVAERYLTARALVASSPQSLHPVTRQIILAGAHGTAADAFAAFYQLAELRGVRDRTFSAIDALVLPTAPTIYTIEQVLADPIGLNSRLGTYTNFVNLLDLCGLSVPASMRPDGTPFGVTLVAPAGEEAALAAIGREFHFAARLPLGALQHPQPPLARTAAPGPREIPIAVVGTHLSGMPLNGELRAAGGRLIERAATAPHYRLYALSGAGPPKPGLLRVRMAPRRDRGRSLGAVERRLRPLRRRGAAAVVDRHARTRRRPQGQRLSGRSRGGRRRARYFELRRLARLHGAGGSIGLMRLRVAKLSARLINKTHMGGDDPPALGKADPGLHLAPDLAGHAGAVKQRRGDCVVAAVGADDGLRQMRPRPTGERAVRNAAISA